MITKANEKCCLTNDLQDGRRVASASTTGAGEDQRAAAKVLRKDKANGEGSQEQAEALTVPVMELVEMLPKVKDR